MNEKIRVENDTSLKQFIDGSDYVHLVIDYPPKTTLSKLVNTFKGTTSCELKRYHPELNQDLAKDNALWSPSYFIGSNAGTNLSKFLELQGIN
ncbi:IS200/IS605 family transposase [Photobacterium aquimaris]|uniref:IS200/IS605 family transposase n=1 Tax=Photobacterium aquimaris TaxID=512643 RepID=A0A2T3IFS2_9GAMM|nr:IS200/IS605 family transposase [Photobacterium aquimaris]